MFCALARAGQGHLSRSDPYEVCLAHRQEVYAFARRLTGAGADADDLLQDVYTRALSALPELREPSRARAWLFAITRRLFLNRRRREALERRFVVMDGGELPELAPPPAVVEPADLERALRALPEEMATPILLCDLWGFCYDEIGEIVGCPIGTVRSRLFRGRALLCAALASETAARSQEKAR